MEVFTLVSTHKHGAERSGRVRPGAQHASVCSQASAPYNIAPVARWRRRERCALEACSQAFRMQAVDHAERALYNKRPQWAVPEEFIFMQPAFAQCAPLRHGPLNGLVICVIQKFCPSQYAWAP